MRVTGVGLPHEHGSWVGYTVVRSGVAFKTVTRRGPLWRKIRPVSFFDGMGRFVTVATHPRSKVRVTGVGPPHEHGSWVGYTIVRSGVTLKTVTLSSLA